VRILYVTKLLLGLEDLIVHGRSEASGMPALLRPLRGLLAAGHQVDAIVGAGPETMLGEVRAPWLQGTAFQLVPCHSSGPQRPASALRLLRAVGAALRRQRYDFVYGHGSLGALACLAARRRGLACGQRLYGVFSLVARLERLPRPAIAMRQPLRYLSFRAAKDFLLITDDGSQGDRAWERLGRRGAFDFHFWRNGVDFAPATADRPELGEDDRFLFMPARITAWKGQHHALEILRQLHATGRTDVKLYLSGAVAEPAYWAEFERLRDAYGLNPFVRYLGSLPLPALVPYYRHSAAVLAPYEQASLGNVVIEALAAGGIVVTQDSPVLDGVISDGENGFRVRSPAEAAARLTALLQKPEQARAMRARAVASARRTFESWDQRVAREIGLIETHVARRKA
jgi:glycosyltransferase involved in cell wall biosynthesis